MSEAFVKPGEYDARGNDINQLWQGIRNYGILSGYSVSPSQFVSQTIVVSSGTAFFGSTMVSSTVSTSIALTPDAINPMKVLILLGPDGSISALYGTPEEPSPPTASGRYTYKPAPPIAPSSSLVLAEIYMNSNDTQITSSKIRDRRVFVPTRSVLVEQLLMTPYCYYTSGGTSITFDSFADASLKQRTYRMGSAASASGGSIVITSVLPSNFLNWKNIVCWYRSVNATSYTSHTLYVYDSNNSLAGAFSLPVNTLCPFTIDASSLTGTFNPEGSISLVMYGTFSYASQYLIWGTNVLRMYIGA